MRCRLAQIAVLNAACLLASEQPIHAQQTVPTAIPESQAETSCPPSPLPEEDQPSGPEISITEVTFSGFLRMPISDQEQIATSIKQRTYGTSPDGAVDEALERAKAGWQDRGYFKVQVGGDAKTLTSNPVSQRIAINVHVDEGLQYALGEITFKHNRAISDIAALRGLFPIKDGDIFSREKIAKGLENLRKAYGELGYLNFTSVPDAEFDDEQKLISVDIDLDEGRQFYLGDIKIVGSDESSRQILKDFPIKHGQIYNERLYEQFLLKHSSMFADCGCGYRRGIERKALDEKEGTINFTFVVRQCPGDL